MNGIVALALRQRVLVVMFSGFMVLAGAIAFMRLNIEAYPDPVPPMVNVITQSQGLSAEEVERYITIPIETATGGLQHLRLVRTTSVFGLSDVKLQFSYDTTYEQALQRVLNQLALLGALPGGAQPQISPMSPIGEIFRYRITGPADMSVTDLKTLQNWVLNRLFRAVPGVVDVVGWGGKNKTYEVSVDFNKMLAFGLTLPQVMNAISNANVNVGGNTVRIGPQAGVVRGVGLMQSMDDIRDTFVAEIGGNPVRIGDIAEVFVSNQPRLGIAGKNLEDDVVQGIVLMRRGEQSMPTILRVQAEVARINAGGVLPPGVQIERIYDRKELIDVTTTTVMHSTAFGIVLIFIIQWLFLGNFRSAVIVASTIPFALSFAVVIMVMRGESANLLSVGALDFGLIVDASVIMTENIFRLLSERSHHRSTHPVHQTDDEDWRERIATILQGSGQVIVAILFSCLIIVASFTPLFTLQGVEGHIFSPMAKTYAYALTGGLLAAFLVSPVLAAYLLKGKLSEEETLLVRGLRRAYEPVLEAAVRRRRLTLIAAAAMMAASLLAARSLGLEFLPKLEEGNMWIRATLHPTISLEEGNDYVNRMRNMVARYPEIDSVVSQQGRTDDGTEVAGFNNVELFAPLRPKHLWREGVDKPKLIAEILAELSAAFPGVDFNFSQYLEDNVAEAASGVKGENSIKLFGNNLAETAVVAQRIRAELDSVRGVEDLAVFNVLGQPTVNITIDRVAAGRYGLTPQDINTAVRVAIGGDSPGDFYEPNSDRRFPIVVRLAPQFRQSPEAIQNLRIGVTQGERVTQIPLNQVATIAIVSGASTIYRERQQRYIPIKFSVRDRDLGSTIAEAQARIAANVPLPPGMRVEWAGEFNNPTDALARMQVIVPLTLLMIAFLLFAYFRSAVDTLLGLGVIPLAMVGGIFALYATGTPFGVSAAIGFIALIGVSVMEGVILITYHNDLVLREGREKVAAAIETCKVRMRPVMMTCFAAAVGLLPAATSTGIGSQVQKPLAFVVVGGIVLAPILILVFLPVFIVLFSRHEPGEKEEVIVERSDEFAT